MNIQEALNEARKRIAPVSESASSDAQILLSTLINEDRVWLLLHLEHELTVEQETDYLTRVNRAASGEPLPYILGRRAFYDRDLLVTPSVLIPRPETELLLEQALNYVEDRSLIAVDVGTGSGALAVTLASLKPNVTVYATDISSNALAVAGKNATNHSANVMFFEGDLLQPLIDRDISCDLIMANLPYIPSDEVDRLVVSQHEPRLALDGGADGLVLIKRLLTQVPKVTTRASLLILLEIMSGQGKAVADLARVVVPDAEVVVLPDYAGHDRIVRIERRVP